MARPHSNDLRERVVAAVTRDGLSRREAARRLGVGVGTAIRRVQRWGETGSIEPGQMGGHRPKGLTGAWRGWLLERCHERAFAVRGLVSERAERGLKVDCRSVWRFVHAERLTHKKDPDRQRAGPRRCGAPSRAVAAPPR